MAAFFLFLHMILYGGDFSCQFCWNGRLFLLLWFTFVVTTGRWSAWFGFSSETLGFLKYSLEGALLYCKPFDNHLDIQHVKGLWWETAEKIITVSPVFGVSCVWFWKCLLSGRQRGEHWKQTHPPGRGSLSRKSIKMQRMKSQRSFLSHGHILL